MYACADTTIRTTDLTDASTRSPELEEHLSSIPEAPEDLDDSASSSDESFGILRVGSRTILKSLVPPSESSESRPPSPNVASADQIPAISDDEGYDQDAVELPASSAASDSGRESIPSDTEPAAAVANIHEHNNSIITIPAPQPAHTFQSAGTPHGRAKRARKLVVRTDAIDIMDECHDSDCEDPIEDLPLIPCASCGLKVSIFNKFYDVSASIFMIFL